MTAGTNIGMEAGQQLPSRSAQQTGLVSAGRPTTEDMAARERQNDQHLRMECLRMTGALGVPDLEMATKYYAFVKGL